MDLSSGPQGIEDGNQRNNNYRKVFKPTGVKSINHQSDGSGHSYDSVERSNALAMGSTPQPNRNQGKMKGYEPQRNSLPPKGLNMQGGGRIINRAGSYENNVQ